MNFDCGECAKLIAFVNQFFSEGRIEFILQYH